MTDAFERDLLAALPDLRGFAESLCPSIGEDLTQETVCLALAHRRQFKPGTSLRGWLFTIAKNRFKTFKIRERRMVADPDGLHAAHRYDTPEQELNLLFAEHAAAFGGMSAQAREAAILVDLDGHSYQEAAKIMGVPIGTVRSRLFRARARYA